MRFKLEPLGLPRGYSYETIRRARVSGKVGHELYLALLRYFDGDEDNESAFLDRFGADTFANDRVVPLVAVDAAASGALNAPHGGRSSASRSRRPAIAAVRGKPKTSR
jgi:hypothetical protein